MMQRSKAIQIMSGHYLCKNFPDNWHKWSDRKLDKFMEDNVWQPFEYWPTDDVFSVIDSAAIELCHQIKEDRKLRSVQEVAND